MFFGRNEECGLRCVYHGWKFDVDGALRRHAVGTAGLALQDQGLDRAYPTWEGGGIVWAYLGPPEPRRRRPTTSWSAHPQRTASSRRRSRTATTCRRSRAESTPRTRRSCTTQNIGDRSFLRRLRGARPADRRRAHRLRLTVHGDPRVRRPAVGAGLPLRDAGDADSRQTSSSTPAIRADDRRSLLGADRRHAHGDLQLDVLRRPRAPADAGVDRRVEHESAAARTTSSRAAVPPQEEPRQRLPHRSRRCRSAASPVSPGSTPKTSRSKKGWAPIVDRSKEHLGTTDRAIIVLRQLLLEAVASVAAGATPPGIDPDSYARVRADSHEVPLDVDWREALRERLRARF